MKKRKVFGLSLIVAGLLLFALNPIANFTGFAIADNIVSVAGSWLYVLGLGMMISGVMLNLYAPRSTRIELSCLEDILRSVPFEEDKKIILDSSFLIDAKRNKGDIDQLIESWGGNVLIPKAIYQEISKGNPFLASKLKQYVVDLSGKDYGKYRALAGKILKKGYKNQVAEFLIPYIENPRLLNRASEAEKRKVQEELPKVRRQVLSEMEKRGIDIGSYEKFAPQIILNEIANYLKKRWIVSEGDTDIFGLALYNSRYGWKVDILGSDTHLRDGWRLLQEAKNKKGGERYRRLSKTISYRDFRKYAEAA